MLTTAVEMDSEAETQITNTSVPILRTIVDVMDTFNVAVLASSLRETKLQPGVPDKRVHSSTCAQLDTTS